MRPCFFGLVAATFAIASPARADDLGPIAACGSIDQLLAVTKQYRERPLWSGVDKAGHPVLLFGEEHGATWTLAVVVAPTRVCLVAVGERSQPVEYQSPKPGA